MTQPLFTPMNRSIAERWLEEDRADLEAAAAAERQRQAAMTPDQLLQLEKQIAAARARANAGENVRERLLELRASHFRGNGSDGG